MNNNRVNSQEVVRHQTAQEYHAAIVAYNVARIKRLEQLTAKQEVVE